MGAVSGEIESHHQVEDDDVWPLLEAVAGDRTALVGLTEDHDRLDPLLHRARELAALDRATPELAAVLREVADPLIRHVADEERSALPGQPAPVAAAVPRALGGPARDPGGAAGAARGGRVGDARAAWRPRVASTASRTGG